MLKYNNKAHSWSISVKIRENYSSLDGLRAYAAVGIVLMHVLANLMI